MVGFVQNFGRFMFGFVQNFGCFMFGFVQNLPPRIHRPNGNMQPIRQNALFYKNPTSKTHYFTYFHLSKRTILQKSPYFTSYLNVYKLSRWLLMVPGNSWRVPKSTTVTLNLTGAVRATSCE